MSHGVVARFRRTQEEAFLDWENLSDHARRHAVVLAFDFPSPAAVGKKQYATVSFTDAYGLLFMGYYDGQDASYKDEETGLYTIVSDGSNMTKFMYEIIQEDRPQRLFYDIDIDVSANPHLATEEAITGMHDSLVGLLSSALDELGQARTPYRFDVETSHRPGKFSLHGKLAAECGVFRGLSGQKAFWGHVKAKMDAAGGPASLPNLYITPTNKLKPYFNQVWDGNVYTANRAMRVIGASKYYADVKKRRVLLPPGVKVANLDTIPMDQWIASLVTCVGDDPLFLDPPPLWELEGGTVFGTAASRDAAGDSLQHARQAVRFQQVLASGKMARDLHDFFDAALSYSTAGTYGWMYWTYGGGGEDKVRKVKQWQNIDNLLRGLPLGVTSLHVQAPFDHWLAFDVDIRETVRLSRHPMFDGCHGPDHRLCAVCWKVAQLAAIVLDEFVTRRLFKSAVGPRWQFSGSGGLHVWYPLYAHDPTPLHTSATARALLIDKMLSKDRVLVDTDFVRRLSEQGPELGLAGISDWVAFYPIFDKNPTALPTHFLRCPFSLNEKSGDFNRRLDAIFPLAYPLGEDD